MLFIGDVHCKIKDYLRIVRSTELPTIQVGDFGFGFITEEELAETQKNPKDRQMRGNHDNPSVANRSSNFIKDGHIENGMMFIGGALSIDRYKRKEGVDWWPDEELSFSKMFEIGNDYADAKPEIVVTHDCPSTIYPFLRSHHNEESATSGFLRNLFEIHQPKLWIFGHHHKSFDETILGTRFRCLAELETMEI